MLKEKLGIGTVQFGLAYGISNTTGQTPKGEVNRILAVALENNITLLDTASAYGTAESVLGETGIDGFNVVSKFMSPAEGENLEIQLRNSLNHLKQGKVYGYLAHRPAELLDKPWLWEELDKLKEQGLIVKRGFSLNRPVELEMLLEKGMIPDIIQVPFNYFDNRFEKLMQDLKSIGCEIHTRSAFLQGLFFKDPNTLPDFFDEVKPILSSLSDGTESLSGKLLRYVLEKPFIDQVVIGVENVQQLQQNLTELASATSLPEMDKPVSENIVMPMHWPQA